MSKKIDKYPGLSLSKQTTITLIKDLIKQKEKEEFLSIFNTKSIDQLKQILSELDKKSFLDKLKKEDKQ